MEEGSSIKVESTDGSLLKGLKLSLNNTLGKLKSGWKMSLFERCFPSLAKDHNSSLEAIRTSVLNPVIEALCSELSSIIKEEISVPLNNLSTLIKNRSASEHSNAWRPSGVPECDMRAHDMKILQYEKQKLLTALAEERQQRLRLFESVKAGRNEVHKNHLVMESHLNKLKEIQGICESIPLDEMNLEKDLL